MKRLVVVLFPILSLLIPSPATVDGSAGEIYKVSDGAHVDFSRLIEDLKKASLVFVGESHDEMRHHEIQLKVIEGLKETGKPIAIGLEMFQKNNQVHLDRWIAGDLDEEAFQKIYYRNWNFPWSFYRDIFVFARIHKIPMIGLNVSREITRKVAREGFASLTPEERGQLPVVTCRVDSAYMEFIRRAYGAHGHHKGSFSNFCEAQLVWDTAMAYHLLEFLGKHPDHIIVVVTGTGHAWKPGIPDQVGLQAKGITYQVILPEIVDRLDSQNVSIKDADYLWLLPGK